MKNTEKLNKGNRSLRQMNVLMRRSLTKSGRLLKNPFSYVETFINDAGVAAVHPSSKYLVARVVRSVSEVNPASVVEFGAAEGVMTKKLLIALGAKARLLAIERNEGFYKELKKIKDERLTAVLGDALDVNKIIQDAGFGEVGCFVSGIPFSFLSAAEREILIQQIYERLPQGGRFVAYQCTTHLIPLLKKRFQHLEIELELRNMPPHFVFTAVKTVKH